MSTRLLGTIVTAAALSAALTAAILQVTLGAPADAATATAPTSALSVSQAQLKSQMRTESLQVAAVKQLRMINTRLLNTNQNLADLNKKVFVANDGLHKLLVFGNLLINSAPSILNRAPRARQGYIPQLLYILDNFCQDAQSTHYGQSSAPGLLIGC